MHSLVQRLQTHPGSRRGGGGVAWGGDACITLGGRALSPARAMQASPPLREPVLWPQPYLLCCVPMPASFVEGKWQA